MNWHAEPLHEVFEQAGIDVTTMTPAPMAGPVPALEGEPPATAWSLSKAASRLQKQIARVESGKWLPRVEFRLSGRDVQELRSAHQLVHEARTLIQEVQR